MDNKILCLPEPKYKRNLIYVGYKYKTDENGKKIITGKRKVKKLNKENKIIEQEKNIYEIDYNNNYYYCMHCKKIVKMQKEEIYKNLGTTIFSSIDYYYICPECGHISLSDEVLYLNTEYLLYKNCFLDDNKLKISFKSIYFTFFNNHIFPNEVKKSFTLNLDTGYSYEFTEMINGKISKKERFINCTYEPINLGIRKYNINKEDNCYEKAYNIIRDYKMKKYNFYIRKYEEQNNEYIELSNLFLFNRFPSSKIIDINFLNTYELSFKNFRRKIKNDEKDIPKKILELNKIPATKNNKRFLVTRQNFIENYKTLKELNLKIDNINKIFNLKEQYIIIDIIAFIKFLLNNNLANENSIINKIAKSESNDLFYIYDTYKMYRDIRQYKQDYKIELKGTFEEIHNKLVIDYNRIKDKPIYFNIEEKYLSLEGEFNNLNFKIAKDSIELITVGTLMNICVGSYKNKVKDGESRIVIAYDKENKPIICIELTPNYHQIVQAKLKFNRGIKEDTDEYKAITEWIEKNNLYVNTYSDIPKEYQEKNNKEVDYFLEGEKGRKVKYGLYGGIIA